MSAIRPEICTKGPLLNRYQKLSLIAPVIHEEDYQALQGIDDMKAPGGNGFNAHFSRKLGQ